MELTLYLSQVLGLFLIINGAAIMMRQTYFAPVIGGFVEERLMRMIIGILELLAGLFLTLGHTDWSTTPGMIIGVIGWLLIVEGTAYLLLSDAAIRKLIRMVNTKLWYTLGGILAILLGLYLAGSGFGFF